MIELTSKKRRGLMIGLMNSGYTCGVSLGAVIAGSLIGVTGWVCSSNSWEKKCMTDDGIEISVLGSNSDFDYCGYMRVLQYSPYFYGWETDFNQTEHLSKTRAH